MMLRIPPTICQSIAAALFLAASLDAATVEEVSPLSPDILALRIIDGTLTRAIGGEPVTADKLEVSPLVNEALAAGKFQISSPDDPAYAQPVSPTRLERKAKGVEFANIEENWNPAGKLGGGFYPTGPSEVMETWLYLNLPSPLISGKTYTVSWPAEVNLKDEPQTFVFEESKIRSEAIHINTIGYLPKAGKKFGYLYHWAGSQGGLDYAAWEGKPFHLVRTDNLEKVFAGNIEFRKPADNRETVYDDASPNANFLSAAVWQADFSSFETPGEYRLVIDGIGSSYPFKIADDVYDAPFQAVMKALYQNRSGIELVLPYADKPRPAPHHPKLTPGFEKRLFYSSRRNPDLRQPETGDGKGLDRAEVEKERKGNLTETWGWYQDAGDWDGYITHARVPINLALLYLSAPAKFTDAQLSLPENKNGIPDILDEAAWLPRFFHRQRQELLKKGWGTGGVGSRVCGDLWGPDQLNNIRSGSWQDTKRDWYVFGEDPWSTFQYASAAALLAEAQRVAGVADPEGVNWKKEATESFAWAVANTKAGDEQKNYDGNLADQRALAAAALYRLTGEDSYHQSFLKDSAGYQRDLNDQALAAVGTYLTMPGERTRHPERETVLKQALIEGTAKNFLDSADKRGLRWAGNFWFPAEIGQATTPYIEPLLLAHPYLKDTDPASAAEMHDTIGTTADYFLGGNPLHTTWITRIGPRPPTAMFHLDDWATGEPIRTGMIPYGPNKISRLWFFWPQRIPGNPLWAYRTTYPPISDKFTGEPNPVFPVAPGNWPNHELWFNQAYSPQIAEFTVHQTLIDGAWTYGYLTPDVVPTKPVAVLNIPTGPYVAPATVSLSAVTSFPDQDVANVEFFASGKKIGESSSRPFVFDWKNAPAGEYTATIKATGKLGAVQESAPVKLVVLSPPRAPGGLSAKLVDGTSINLAWLPAPGVVENYEIEHALTPTGPWTVLVSPAVGTKTWQATGLTPETRHSFRIRARNYSGYSPFSPVASATTGPDLDAGYVGFDGEESSWPSFQLNPKYEIVEPGLTYPGLLTRGGALASKEKTDPYDNTVLKLPGRISEGVFWISMLVTPGDGDPEGSLQIWLRNSEGEDERTRERLSFGSVSYSKPPFPFGLRYKSEAQAMSDVLPQPKTTYFLVVSLDLATGEARLFVNPPVSPNAPAEANATVKLPPDQIDFDEIRAVVGANTTGRVDEIRVGRSWGSVVVKGPAKSGR